MGRNNLCSLPFWENARDKKENHKYIRKRAGPLPSKLANDEWIIEYKLILKNN